MKRIEHDAETGSPHADSLTLPFELRCKSRLRVRLDGGQEAALLLPRGRVLRGGDLLRAEDGTVVLVRAAAEQVSTVRATDAATLTRAAYHLGNRHVAVEIGEGFVRYQHDHVLDDMVRALGLIVHTEHAPFEPEGGAYANAGHSHAHPHAHAHPRAHAHPHAHAHPPKREQDR